MNLDRRSLLRAGLIAGAQLLVPGAALAGMFAPQAPRTLRFYNLHTGESLNTVYWERGEYVPEALSEINYLLRDFRANEIKPIDPKLLDLLVALDRKLGTGEPFHVISGYRSPATNAALHANSEGVASHSLHMEGRAIDINVPGRNLTTLHRAALMLGLGGVGFYPKSDFVHVDTGRPRWW